MRITDIFLAFPKLVLALAFVAALGPGIQNAIIAIAITSWPPYAFRSCARRDPDGAALRLYLGGEADGRRRCCASSCAMSRRSASPR